MFPAVMVAAARALNTSSQLRNSPSNGRFDRKFWAAERPIFLSCTFARAEVGGLLFRRQSASWQEFGTFPNSSGFERSILASNSLRM